MKKLFSLFILVLFLSACGNSSEKAEAVVGNYELQIVDSVQVDLFSQGLNVMDVNDKTGDILAIQSDPPVVYVLNAKGEILKKMDKPADSPEGVGSYVLSAEFYEDGFALMGHLRVKTYDSDFNVRKSTRVNGIQSGMIYLGSNHLMELKGEDHNRLVAYFGPHSENSPLTEEFYQDFTIFDVLDPYLASDENLNLNDTSSLVYKPVAKLDSESRFLTSGRAFYFLRPIFDLKDHSFYYAFESDTTLYELSVPDGKTLSKVSIPFDSFIPFDGYTMGQAGLKEQGQPGDRSGRIEKVFHVGDMDVVIYTSGIKRSKIEEFDVESPDFRDQLRKLDYKKYLILKDGKRMNADLRLPNKISYFNISDNDGYLWARQNINDLEEEPDLITFYKMKVVPVK